MALFEDIITQITLSAAETMILYFLYRAFLHRKISVPYKLYILGLFSYFVFQFITYIKDCPLFSTALLYFVFTLLLAVLFFSDTMAVKMITCYLFVVLNYSCKLVAATMNAKIFNLHLPEIPFELVLIPSSQITACLLFLICTGLTITFRNLRIHKRDRWYTIITYTAPTGILLLVMHQFTMHAKSNIAFEYLDAAGILFFTAMEMFFMIDSTVVIDETSRKNSIIKQLLEMQQNYYKSIESSQKEISSIRHDLKNHLQSIVYMLDQGEYKQSKDYIQKIYTTTNRLTSPLYSGNNMVDILLNKTLARAKNEGVNVDLNVMLPANLPIDDIDICIILGNLLDNAMEACARMKKEEYRNLSIQIQKKKSYLFLCISNSFNGEVHIVNNIYESVKKSERFCGIGLSNVKNVVEKYNGDIKLHNTDKVFTVTAILPVENNQHLFSLLKT